MAESEASEDGDCRFDGVGFETGVSTFRGGLEAETPLVMGAAAGSGRAVVESLARVRLWASSKRSMMSSLMASCF